MPTSLKIECPVCKRNTELIDLEFPKATEKDNLMAKTSLETLVWTEMSPEQSRAFYNILTRTIPESTITLSISRIKSHSTGLFKERCSISDKVFKVYHYYVIDHTKQIARSTFRLGEEIHDFYNKSQKD